jgi:hypothetical protein
MKARAEFLRADAHVTKLNVEELMSKVIQFVGGVGISSEPAGIEVDRAMDQEASPAGT